jgi:G3E family GTPase
VRVDSIITIVDADNFSLDLFASEAAHNQLRYADVILLNKCDLTGADRLRSIEERIREFREGARILRTNHCRVPLALILGVGLFQSDSYLIDCSDHSHAGHGETHLVNDGFEAISFEGARPFSADRFQQFLERLSDNVFRAKGVRCPLFLRRIYLFLARYLPSTRVNADGFSGVSGIFVIAMSAGWVSVTEWTEWPL